MPLKSPFIRNFASKFLCALFLKRKNSIFLFLPTGCGDVAVDKCYFWNLNMMTKAK